MVFVGKGLIVIFPMTLIRSWTKVRRKSLPREREKTGKERHLLQVYLLNVIGQNGKRVVKGQGRLKICPSTHGKEVLKFLLKLI